MPPFVGTSEVLDIDLHERGMDTVADFARQLRLLASAPITSTFSWQQRACAGAACPTGLTWLLCKHGSKTTDVHVCGLHVSSATSTALTNIQNEGFGDSPTPLNNLPAQAVTAQQWLPDVPTALRGEPAA